SQRPQFVAAGMLAAIGVAAAAVLVSADLDEVAAALPGDQEPGPEVSGLPAGDRAVLQDAALQRFAKVLVFLCNLLLSRLDFLPELGIDDPKRFIGRAVMLRWVPGAAGALARVRVFDPD